MTYAVPPVGLRHSMSIAVDSSMTVPQVSPVFRSFEDMPAVFATAHMIGLVEATCAAAIKPYLGDQQRTVGIHVDVSHMAATPVGMTVTANVELIACDKGRLRFRVECSDNENLISAGLHDRFIVDLPRFVRRLEEKAARRRAAGK